jgi:hypothetical protein
MTKQTREKRTFRFLGNLSRSQRTLVSALSFILLPTCVGLSLLLSDFWMTNQSSAEEYVHSTARDTLLMAGYEQCIRLFSISQEAYADPSKRAILKPRTEPLVRSLHGIGTSYIDLLTNVPPAEKERLLVRFVSLWSKFDEVVEKSEKVFAQSTDSKRVTGERKVSFVGEPRSEEHTSELQSR